MRNIIKDVLKSALITALLAAGFYLLTALIILKHGIDSELYFPLLVAINGMISAIVTWINRKKEKASLLLLPLMLIETGLAVAFDGLSYKLMILLAVSAVIHFGLLFLCKYKRKQRKNYGKSMRKSYEKIRKKQHYQH